MDADRLKGMTIVALDDAERMGQISDLLLEADPLRVSALEAASGDTRFTIPFDKVRKLGSDAVTVDDTGVARSSAGAIPAHLHRLSALHELKVVDQDGTFLGTIATVEVDDASGHVTELETRKGGVLGVGGERGTIAASAIRSVGSEVLTVTTPNAGDAGGVSDRDRDLGKDRVTEPPA